MSELAETFRAMSEASKEKRGANRENALKILRDNKIEFEVKNLGAHLIIKCDPLIDFWPGTGLWKSRNGKKGRGIRNLIKHLNR